jgi:hypothetical protein
MCGTAVCFPGFPTADTAGCAPGPPAPDGGECDDDDDPCTDDRCERGRCAHPNVPDRRTCEPVLRPYRRTLALREATAAFGGLVAAQVTHGGRSDATRELLDERLAAMMADLDLVARILKGRLPTGGGGETVAQQRARAALPLTSGLIVRARSAVGLLRLGRRAGEVPLAVARDLGLRARALLAAAKALKRDLKRLQLISRVFAS